MNDEHVPVDHKDDTAEYRVLVWDIVQKRVGAELIPLAANSRLDGTWDVAFDMFGTRQALFRYEFHTGEDVEVVTLQGNDQTPGRGTYSVRREGQLTISGETYHAATTKRGELVLFNGDSSLLLIATKR